MLKVLSIVIIPVGVLLLINQLQVTDYNVTDSIFNTVGALIGMIPEGLVLLTSISLTVGVIKMASKKVIIQKLSGIELLACVDILCLDKTGTITTGVLEVVEYKTTLLDSDFFRILYSLENNLNSLGLFS